MVGPGPWALTDFQVQASSLVEVCSRPILASIQRRPLQKYLVWAATFGELLVVWATTKEDFDEAASVMRSGCISVGSAHFTLTAPHTEEQVPGR